MILAVHNPKGGVGKTATAVNLATALARSHRKVLLVDLEPFASASLALGVRRQDLRPSIADVLLNHVRAAEAVRPAPGAPDLRLITGSLAMANIDMALRHVRQPERRLADAVRPLNVRFDIVILDTPCGFSLIPLSALAAAQELIVPVTAEYVPLEALAQFLQWYHDLRSQRKGLATLLGILLTMVDNRAQATREIIEILRVHNRGGVFTTEIPRDPRLAEAPSHGLPVAMYSPRSRAAAAYERLAQEVLRRLSKRSH